MGAVASRVVHGREADRGGELAIRLEGMTKRFGNVVAVDDCWLAVERGEFVSLLGPSGCGKTTLLRIVAGFESADSGRVLVHGKRVDRLPPNKRPVNMVFQRYALFPHKTVFENIAFPLELGRVPKRERATRVREMLELVRLPGVEDRSPAKLSGGQAQRVALARALVLRPDVLLLDEPLTALDLKLRKAMQLELRRIHEELGTTFLYVTHDQEEALTMSDRIVLMNDGRIVQEGDPAEIYERPRSVFASHFIGEANLLRGTVTAAESDSTRVRVGNIEIVAPAHAAEAGQEVVVSVRPERIAIGAAGAVLSAQNLFDGRIGRRIFLGNLVRFLVELAPGVVATVQASVEAAGLTEGDDVVVGWERDSSIVLTEQ